jgi:hypothetical protein
MDSEESGIEKEQVWHVGLLKYHKKLFKSGDGSVSDLTYPHSLLVYFADVIVKC